MNEDSQYLVLLENEQFGPYSLDVMREMQLLPDTWVKNLEMISILHHHFQNSEIIWCI